MVGPRDNLLHRLQLNNQDAYYELVDTYGDQLLRLAYMVVGDRQVAEDVVQETFLALYEKLATFRGDSSLYTWLTRVTLNKAKNKIRPSFLQRITYFGDITATDTRPAPLDTIEIRERQHLVQQVLLVLPIKYREVLYLHYYEDIKVKEIAQLLDISESGVKSRLQRGREQLKIELTERGLG